MAIAMNAVEGRYIVVGGGLLGSHTAIHLVQLGARVAIYSRSFTPWLTGISVEDDALELVEGAIPPGPHLEDSPELMELIEGADGVFLFAGSSTPALSASDPAGSVAASVAPALSVLDIVSRTSTARVVIASSGGTVYGKPSRIPTPESEPLRPISVHGVNSVAIEMYADYYARCRGIEPVVLRFSNVYGPGERARFRQGVVAAWCGALARGEPLSVIGDGETRRDMIYVRDAAAAAASALECGAPSTYNVGGGRSYALNEVLETLKTVTASDPSIERHAGNPVDVPVTELDSTAFRDETGWRPRTELSAGIAETWSWTSRLASTDLEGTQA